LEWVSTPGVSAIVPVLVMLRLSCSALDPWLRLPTTAFEKKPVTGTTCPTFEVKALVALNTLA
jgi:hypothetical protein